MTNLLHLNIKQQRNFATAAALLAGLISASTALANDTDARLAIARAESKIDLLSAESSTSTQSPAFTLAHDRLTQANAAIAHNDNRQAEWLANEAEILADNAAGAGKLARLVQIRTDASHQVDLLNVTPRP